MDDNENCTPARWYLVHTYPGKEDRVERTLRAEGLETCNPRLKERCYDQSSGQPVHLIKPLFREYIFVRFEPRRSLKEVRCTKGVHCVVGSGSELIPIEDSIIRIIHSRTGEDGFITIVGKPELGHQVPTADSAFKDFCAMLDRPTEDGERVKVLLMTLGYQIAVSKQSPL